MGAGSSQSSGSPVQATGAAVNGASGCPVKHAGKSETNQVESKQVVQVAECPVKKTSQQQAPISECPVKGKTTLTQQYNVYSQPIDPTNQMPLNPNQLPAPGQTKALSTERVASFIPKGGTDSDTWLYPSPQMFYNALVRKGKAEPGLENEVETIVAVHNNMNEKAWNLVVAWERTMHPEDFKAADGIKLSRFQGRPDDISPMAWIKSTFLGYPRPFDRHDWVVDRNGTEVRYVIDYYYRDELGKQDEKPALHDMRSVKSIDMDARPAVDSFTSLVDRVKYPVLEYMKKTEVVPMEENAPQRVRERRQNAVIDEPLRADQTTFESLQADELKTLSRDIKSQCNDCFAKMNSCSTENECQRASVTLTHCMAELVCKPEAAAYRKAPTSEQAFDSMVGCMGRFEEAAIKIRQHS